MIDAMDEETNPFERRAVRQHRERAAAGLARHDFLFREVGERLLDRLDDVTHRFPLALDLGCHGGELGCLLAGRGGIEHLLQLDLSFAMARRARDAAALEGAGLTLVADEEMLPIAPQSLDLVLSNLSLHWVNDLPGALIQIRAALKPDGLFLAAMLGGECLAELRTALIEAELEEEGGASPRLSPFADLRDAAGLLQRAGFALPLADRDEITVSYPDAIALMRDLRGMGETNAVRERRRGFSRRATLLRAAAIYGERFGGSDGRIPARFQIVYLTGWAPHEAQQQPLRPGSAKTRLADALGTVERAAGDRAPRG
jgi:SAM-dependent methyltransferase